MVLSVGIRKTFFLCLLTVLLVQVGWGAQKISTVRKLPPKSSKTLRMGQAEKKTSSTPATGSAGHSHLNSLNGSSKESSAARSSSVSSLQDANPSSKPSKIISGEIDAYMIQGLSDKSTLTNAWWALFSANPYKNFDVGTELGYTHMFTRYQGPGNHNDFTDAVLFLQAREVLGKPKSEFVLDTQFRVTLPASETSRNASMRAVYSLQAYAKSKVDRFTFKLKPELILWDYRFETSSAYGTGYNPHYGLLTTFTIDFAILSNLIMHNQAVLFNRVKYSGFRVMDYRLNTGLLYEFYPGFTADLRISNGDNFYDSSGLFSADHTSIQAGIMYEF